MWLDRFWLEVRAEAGLADVRLHDLRHSYASMALMSGESVRDARPPARSRACHDHPEIRTPVRCIGPGGGGRPGSGSLAGSAHDGPDEDTPHGRRRREVEAGQDGIRGVGQPRCRAGRTGAPVGPSQLRLARACKRRSGAENRSVRLRSRPSRTPVGNASRYSERHRNFRQERREGGVCRSPRFGILRWASGRPHPRVRWGAWRRKSVHHMLEKQLLPAFGPLRLDRIRRPDVERWFDAYSRTAPGGANHALQAASTDHEGRDGQPA